MFGLQRGGTVIAEGLRIVGSVTADGLVEVNGQIEGEIHCTSLIVSRQAQVAGTITAEQVVVDGRVEGPIQGGEVVLKSWAHVVGDIHHQSLAVEKGAYFEGRSVQAHGANGRQPDRSRRTLREALNNSHEADAAAEWLAAPHSSVLSALRHELQGMKRTRHRCAASKPSPDRNPGTKRAYGR